MHMTNLAERMPPAQEAHQQGCRLSSDIVLLMRPLQEFVDWKVGRQEGHRDREIDLFDANRKCLISDCTFLMPALFISTRRIVLGLGRLALVMGCQYRYTYAFARRLCVTARTQYISRPHSDTAELLGGVRLRNIATLRFGNGRGHLSSRHLSARDRA